MGAWAVQTRAPKSSGAWFHWISAPLAPASSRSESLSCEFACLEPSPAAQDEDQFAAAAPRQTLPGLRLTIAGDLETATRAFEAPAKRQQVLGDHPLWTTTILPRRLRRRLGRQGHLVEYGDLLPGQPFAGPGPSQQRGSFGHVPPCLSSPRSGSGSRCYANVHGPAFRAFRTVFSLTSRSPAIFLPDAPASFMRRANCTWSSVRHLRRPRVLPRALAAAKPSLVRRRPTSRAPGPPPTPPC